MPIQDDSSRSAAGHLDVVDWAQHHVGVLAQLWLSGRWEAKR